MKRLILLIFALSITILIFSANLKNVPIDLKQPDGSIIICYVTGDEFHRRTHDKDNYTIVQDPDTGFYVYALLSDDQLKPSGSIVGRVNPKNLPLQPGYDIPFKLEEFQKHTLKSGKFAQPNSTKGDFNNIIISIRFSDQSPTSLSLQDYETKFNSISLLSLKSYYKEVSSSQLNVSSSFYPRPEHQTILEYQDSHPRAYYLAFNAISNPGGYKNEEAYTREQSLIKNAIESVKSQIMESQVNYDLNNDGFIDNLIFIIQGYTDAWGNILWPMATSLYGSQIFIGNKIVNQYNKQLSDLLNVDVLCHEFFHSLGAPDLYHYSFDDLTPVGAWDLMGTSGNQHMTTFMKWRYGKWFSTIPEISQPGTYTLLPVSQSSNACFKIPSPDDPNEYFVVEYRKKEGLLESTIPSNYSDGLLVYRINTQLPWGNAGGPPDEVYIYRKDGTISNNGDISLATFSSNTSRTIFNNDSNPSCFLSSGLKGWIDISNVSSTGAQISFTINPVSPIFKPRNLTVTMQGNQIVLKWASPRIKSSTFLGYNIYIGNSNSPINTTLVKDTTFVTSLPEQKYSYMFKVTAKYQLEESESVNYNFINPESPEKKDSLALVALYNKCNGSNWERQTNWLKGQLRTWQGVTVENGRVVGLNLGSENGISVGLIGSIPTEISNLTDIRVLSLENNQITGLLPDDWSELTNLQELLLSNNQFTGELPSNWSSLQNLVNLQLSYNKITGTLPSTWSSLVNLKYMSMDNNQLSGPLPDSWSSLLNLNELSLNSNLLSGSLPQSWSSLINLYDLRLSNNLFSGSLPSSWSSLKNMQLLNISDNQIAGSLPSTWSSLINLYDLRLSNNQLSGTLPSSWSSFVNLEQLMLNNNKLSGIIPQIWSNLSNLNYFDINSNQISGLPTFSLQSKLSLFYVENNLLDFEYIEPIIGVPKNTFRYSPQLQVGKSETIYKRSGEEFRISVVVGGKSNKYQWFMNGYIIPNANLNEYVIPSVSYGNSAVYTCHITNAAATQLTLQSFPITLKVEYPVAAAGIIMGESAVCQRQSSVVYSIPEIANATSYIWTLPTGATETSSTNTITVNYEASSVSGIISVKGHNSIGDGIVSTLPITVNSIPVTPIITQSGNVLHSDAPTGNQWYNRNYPISGATGQDYTITANGEYTVQVNLKGCPSAPSNMIKEVATSLISSEFNEKIRVYPNPVLDDLTIEYIGNMSEIKFEIFSPSGQLITTGILIESTVIHTSSFSCGLYTIKFNTGNRFEFRKMIKLN